MDHVEYREFEAMCCDKDSIVETIETYNRIYNKSEIDGKTKQTNR